MLTHPTIDLVHTLSLNGMAKGVKALEALPETRELDTPNGSASSSTMK